MVQWAKGEKGSSNRCALFLFGPYSAVSAFALNRPRERHPLYLFPTAGSIHWTVHMWVPFLAVIASREEEEEEEKKHAWISFRKHRHDAFALVPPRPHRRRSRPSVRSFRESARLLSFTPESSRSLGKSNGRGGRIKQEEKNRITPLTFPDELHPWLIVLTRCIEPRRVSQKKQRTSFVARPAPLYSETLKSPFFFLLLLISTFLGYIKYNNNKKRVLSEISIKNRRIEERERLSVPTNSPPWPIVNANEWMKKRKWFDVRMPHSSPSSSFFFILCFVVVRPRQTVDQQVLSAVCFSLLLFTIRALWSISLSIKNWCRRSACDSMRPFAHAQWHRWSSLFIRMREILCINFITTNFQDE